MVAVMAQQAFATQTKETLIVKENPKEFKHRPAVSATNNQYCAVEADDLEVCFDFGVGLKIGWDFDQKWTDEVNTPDELDGYYTFELTFYSEQEINLEFHLFVQRLIDIVLSGELTEFQLQLNLGFNYNYKSMATCVFGQYAIDDFFLKTFLEVALVQFYKDVIESLWTIDNWTSKWALIFDEIELSNSEQIQLYKQQIDILSAAGLLYGIVDPEPTDAQLADVPSLCWPLWWGGTDPRLGSYNYAADAMERITRYMD